MTASIQTASKQASNTKPTFGIVLRSTCFNLLMLMMTVFFSVTGLLIFWSPFKVRYRYITLWSKCIIWLARTICGIQVNVTGKQHLPKSNAIVLCNHQSTWETLFLQTLLPPQTWVLKKELLNIPFFGWGLALLEPIAINRKKKHSIKFLIKNGKQRLAQGRWVVIFPEGTRVKPGENKKYSRSGGALAIATQYPVLAIAHNAGKFWPKNSFFKYPGTIQLHISKQFDSSAQDAQTLTKQISTWIDDQIKET